MPLKHLPSWATPDDVTDALRADGACIVDNLVSNDVMDRVAAEMQPYIELSPEGADEFTGVKTRRTGAMIARSPASRDLIMHPLVLGASGIILKDSPIFQLNLTQVISVLPGETDQPLHRDQVGWGAFPFPTDYDMMCNTIWALTDFTVENGATRVLAGTHLLPPLAKAAEATAQRDTERAEMTRGSVLFYTGKVFHGAGANHSEDIRQGINITYCLGWLRQEENQFLSTPLEVARTLDDDLLKVMGYQPTPLGYVRDFENPMVILRPDTPKVAHSVRDQLGAAITGSANEAMYAALYGDDRYIDETKELSPS
jgi:ectoine hydroxylase-related dioxygenase (phytanoyl-CoA dioxygenase family)